MTLYNKIISESLMIEQFNESEPIGIRPIAALTDAQKAEINDFLLHNFSNANYTKLMNFIELHEDMKARFLSSPIANKTPAEIYTLMQGRIDGWSNLASAKADLRTWLPFMAAAIAWMVMERME